MTLTGKQLAAIKVGYGIHVRLIDEGRRETAARTDGTRVMCYLDHDLIGSGKLPFVRHDTRTGEIGHAFSDALKAEIRQHRDELKVYFAYCRACDLEADGKGSAPRGVGTSDRT